MLMMQEEEKEEDGEKKILQAAWNDQTRLQGYITSQTTRRHNSGSLSSAGERALSGQEGQRSWAAIFGWGFI